MGESDGSELRVAVQQPVELRGIHRIHQFPVAGCRAGHFVVFRYNRAGPEEADFDAGPAAQFLGETLKFSLYCFGLDRIR